MKFIWFVITGRSNGAAGPCCGVMGRSDHLKRGGIIDSIGFPCENIICIC